MAEYTPIMGGKPVSGYTPIMPVVKTPVGNLPGSFIGKPEGSPVATVKVSGYQPIMPGAITPTTPQYFSTTTSSGASFGPSLQKDTSGRPFLDYRAPGDTSTTTDKTRVSTTIDPMTPAKLDSKSFYNPRSVANRAELKTSMGGDYSDELDHKIALELSGSNDKSNLMIQPGLKGGAASESDKIENSLAKDVASGKISLFEAQTRLAQQKGIDTPYTGGPKADGSINPQPFDVTKYTAPENILGVKTPTDISSSTPKISTDTPWSDIYKAAKNGVKIGYDVAYDTTKQMVTHPITTIKDTGIAAYEVPKEAFNSMEDGFANAFRDISIIMFGVRPDAEGGAIPQATHEQKPGLAYKIAGGTGSLISGVAEYEAGGALFGPVKTLLAASSPVINIVGNAFIQGAIPAMVNQMAPLQPGESATDRFLTGLPMDILSAGTTFLPNQTVAALTNALGSFGIGAAQGQDLGSNTVNSIVMGLFGFAGPHNLESSQRSIEDVKTRAHDIINTPLGDNPTPQDLYMKALAHQFLSTPEPKQNIFINQVKNLWEGFKATPNKQGGFIKIPGVEDVKPVDEIIQKSSISTGNSISSAKTYSGVLDKYQKDFKPSENQSFNSYKSLVVGTESDRTRILNDVRTGFADNGITDPKLIVATEDFLRTLPKEILGSLRGIDFSEEIRKQYNAAGIYQDQKVTVDPRKLVANTIVEEIYHHIESTLTINDRSIIDQAFEISVKDNALMEAVFGDKGYFEDYMKYAKDKNINPYDVARSEFFAKLGAALADEQIKSDLDKLAIKSPLAKIWDKVKEIFKNTTTKIAELTSGRKQEDYKLSENIDPKLAELYKKIYEPNIEVVDGKMSFKGPLGKSIGTAKSLSRVYSYFADLVRGTPGRDKNYDLEKANRDYNKSENQQAKKEGNYNTELQKAITERDILKESNDKASGLMKYVSNSTGQLPEVTGKATMSSLTGNGIEVPNSYFGIHGDDIVTEQGFPNVQAAQDAIDARIKNQDRLGELTQRIAELKSEDRNKKAVELAKQKMDNLRAKAAAHVEKLMTADEKKAARNAKILKKEQLTQLKYAETERKQHEYRKAVEDAIKQSREELTLKKRWRDIFSPLKNTDAKTQEIYKNWVGDVLVAKESARILVPEIEKIAYESGYQNSFREVMDQEAGAKIPYITNATEELWTRAKRAGFDLGHREDHMSLYWSETPKEVQGAIAQYLKDKGVETILADEVAVGNKELPEDIALRLRINPAFIKARSMPDYATGMKYGLTPRFNTPAEIIAFGEAQLNESIANRNFIQSMIDSHKLLDPGDAPKNWVYVTTPFTYDAYKASPELASVLNRISGNETTPEWVLRKVGSAAGWTQEMVLSGGIGNVNFFSMGQAIKSLTTAIGDVATLDFKSMNSDLKNVFSFFRANFNTPTAKYFVENQPYFTMMAKERIGTPNRIGGLDEKSFADVYHNLTSLQVGKTLAGVGEGFNKIFNEKTFQAYMPMMMVETFKGEYNRGIERGLSVDEARIAAAKITKRYNGIVDDVARSQGVQNGLKTLFMAPKFRESLINFFSNNIKSISTEFGNKEFTKNRKFMVGAIITYALYNLLQKKETGKYMWENKPADMFNLVMPISKTFGKFLPGYKEGDVARIPMLPSIAAFPKLVISGVGALAQGDFGTAEQQASGLASIPIQTISQITRNQDYWGSPIYKDTDSGFTKLKKLAIYTGLAINHPYLQGILNLAGNSIPALQEYGAKPLPLYQNIARTIEFPMTFTNLTKQDNTIYFDDLATLTGEKAKSLEAFSPTYEKIKKMAVSGDKINAAKEYNALSATDKKLFMSLKRGEVTKTNLQNERLIYPTVLKVKDLVAAGDKKQAQDIYNGLTDAEKKSFLSVKKKFFGQ